uniref:DET1- and DDB1-associated protein 1 n=1 Tax=Kalanchoe fedtschenkoi TaxID=63787 RepID=A0A7N0SVN6_KALFE
MLFSPEAQLIRTNETNILIRYLTSKKNKSDSKRPCRENSSKRVSENELDRRSKRAVASSQSSSRHGTYKLKNNDLITLVLDRGKMFLILISVNGMLFFLPCLSLNLPFMSKDTQLGFSNCL